MPMKKITSLVLLLFATLFCFAQSKISGKVVLENGDPVKGASITVKGTANGTTTDDKGAFSINAPFGSVLVITSIGYDEMQATVSGNEINITLREQSRTLSDVVVVGYGTQRRRSVTGAISKVNAKEITALPVTDPRQALQGRVPGLTVVNNGSPGEAPIVRIRGIGSINYASEPFYVIDGFPGADLSMIDSRDIESIDVLRDASSAAIYGSRSANGVIMVTTKKASRDKLRVTLDSYYGMQSAWKQLDLLNTEEYIRYATALKQNAGAALPARFNNLDAPIYAGATQTYRQTNTDWQDEMFRNAPISQTNLAVSNGTDRARFYTSVGYMKQEGIMLGTEYQRFNFRFNSDFNINKIFTVGQNLTVAFEDKLNENNGGGRSQLKHIIHNVPYIPVKDPTLPGGYRGPSGDDGSDPQNPVRLALQDISRNNSVKMLGSAYLEANILNGLKYRFTAGINFGSFVNRVNNPIYNESFNARALNRVEQSTNNYRSIYLSNQLTYEKTIGKHTFSVTGVAERQDGKSRNLFAGGNYTTNELQGVTNAVRDPGLNGGLFEDVLFSYLGRVTYEYDGKYLLSGSYRRDGSSVFAPGNKWANFPSVSAGWRISEEGFMKNLDIISELKLRGSWGKMGFNGIGNYAWQPVLQQNSAPIIGDTRVPSAFFNQLGNSDLRWEITTMTNVGLDVGFFNNALTFTAEYYIRKTDGLILQTPLAPSLGFSLSTPANVGAMENRGFEFIATYAKRQGNFTWDVSANLSTVRNKVLNFGSNIRTPIFAGNSADFGGFDITRTLPGDAVQSFYGWGVTGIFQSQAEIDSYNLKDGNAATLYQPNAKPGDIIFTDINNDGTINSDDRFVMGSFIPKFSYGASFNAAYKNFDFSIFLQGVAGNKIYNGTKVLTQGMLRLFGAGKEVLNAWTPTNTNTEIPRAVDGDPNNNTRTSERFLEDGSYLRVKALSIGYSLPKAVLGKFAKGAVSNFRAYISTQNLLTFTRYTGYDPEIGSRFNAALTSGIDYGQFPQARTILFGIQVGF
jgi:TonB-linked SusC/RagA family outer membrane protein